MPIALRQFRCLLNLLIPFTLAAGVRAQVPDVSHWALPQYPEEFFQGRAVCGEEALRFWMQSCNWRGNRDGVPEKFAPMQRLLGGDPQQAALVNREIQSECRRALADVPAWHKSHPYARAATMWMLLALRAPDRLTPETRRVLCDTLRALDLAKYVSSMSTRGANGANVHGYVSPLALAPSLIDDAKVLAAGHAAMRGELEHMNGTGDFNEYNLLESHWTGTASWEMMKRYVSDPHARRMARMISERLWINRFLTWSPVVERITGPGSRMAPSEWLGCDNERALFGTAVNRPIWINFFFVWDGWDSRAYHANWPLAQAEAAVPVLPGYLQDLAWNKSLPNELQCRLTLKHWKNYPPLEGVPQGDPLRPAKYVNYQTQDYALGSSTTSWVVNTCVVGMSAWWNNSRAPTAALGSPQRFCVLYPHYVINGMSFLDRGEIHFTNKPGKPVIDAKGGVGGPYLREFVDFGRTGIVQDRNTLLLSYSTKAGTHYGDLVKDKVQRASAGMFLFRWTDGTDGLYVNRRPVRTLPVELQAGDWWFIEDGDVYAAVRPLSATPLKGRCRTVLEKRIRHVVLYQDNVAADNIAGIKDEDWVKARNGFVVEMGDRGEYGSFARFQDRILTGRVTADEAEGFQRHLAYQRDDRRLEMGWHCYTEEYATRKIGGRDDPWPQFLDSPEFSVSDRGRLHVKDATLETAPGKTTWLLAAPRSRTWVAYQTNVGQELPLTLDCPAGRLTCKRFPFGKAALTRGMDGSVSVDLDVSYPAAADAANAKEMELLLDTNATRVTAQAGATALSPRLEPRGSKPLWRIDPLKSAPTPVRGGKPS
jgi:hypothetical protein